MRKFIKPAKKIRRRKERDLKEKKLKNKSKTIRRYSQGLKS